MLPEGIVCNILIVNIQGRDDIFPVYGHPYSAVAVLYAAVVGVSQIFYTFRSVQDVVIFAFDSYVGIGDLHFVVAYETDGSSGEFPVRITAHVLSFNYDSSLVSAFVEKWQFHQALVRVVVDPCADSQVFLPFFASV